MRRMHGTHISPPFWTCYSVEVMEPLSSRCKISQPDSRQMLYTSAARSPVCQSALCRLRWSPHSGQTDLADSHPRPRVEGVKISGLKQKACLLRPEYCKPRALKRECRESVHVMGRGAFDCGKYEPGHIDELKVDVGMEVVREMKTRRAAQDPTHALQPNLFTYTTALCVDESEALEKTFHGKTACMVCSVGGREFIHFTRFSTTFPAALVPRYRGAPRHVYTARSCAKVCCLYR